MENLGHNKKELFKNWDEYGVNLENRIVEETCSNKMEQERNLVSKVNQKLRHRILKLEKEKEMEERRAYLEEARSQEASD